MKFSFIYILIFVCRYASAQDSTQLSNTKLKFATTNVNEKYNFSKIGSKAIKIGNVKQDFYANAALAGGVQLDLNAEAKAYIQWFTPKNEAELKSMKNWGSYYLSSMQNILVSRGIPKQLVYLAVIETHLNPNLVSWAGAAGMWQFIPETGRIYGLQIGGGIDERFDWNKSTYAACGYLHYLYNLYHDWLLVVAAYNGGPGRVNSAIKQSGSRDFWKLQHYLRLESKNHVKKFIATQYIMEGNTSIGIAGANSYAPPKKHFNPLEKGAVALDTSKGLITEKISGRYNSLIIAKHILLDIQSFNILNPSFDEAVAKENSDYDLRLPLDKMNMFRQHKLQIMNESLYLYLTLATTTATNTAEPSTKRLSKPTKKKG